MELNTLEILSNLGGIVIIAALCYLFGREQLNKHKESLDRVCDSYKETHERTCLSFERALDRRDKDIELLTTEIRLSK